MADVLPNKHGFHIGGTSQSINIHSLKFYTALSQLKKQTKHNQRPVLRSAQLVNHNQSSFCKRTQS